MFERALSFVLLVSSGKAGLLAALQLVIRPAGPSAISWHAASLQRQIVWLLAAIHVRPAHSAAIRVVAP